MANTFTNPGDVLEGSGVLLQHGRLIAHVDYHLTIPSQTHFLINPTGSIRSNYDDQTEGFILLTPKDAQTLSFTEYTLELVNKHKRTIRIERRYKQIKHKDKDKISFWVKVIGEARKTLKL